MRKLAMGITALFCVATQNSTAGTVMVAQDQAVDSDVVLENAVNTIKTAPRDTVNVIGDSVKYVTDETVTAAKGVASVFKSDPVKKAEKEGMLGVANAWNSANDILFRSYKVSSAVGEELIGNANVSEGDTLDVSGAFAGIEFPENTSAFFRPKFNRLFVRNTQSNLFAVEDVLAELHSAERDLMGKQVSIETKFVEVNQSTLQELGFKWHFDSKSGDAANLFDNLLLPKGQDIMASGLRTAAGALGGPAATGTMLVEKTSGSLRWSMLINALEQSDGADVLSAPSIVTRDGSTASIMVGEERTVSNGFDVKNSESSLFIEHDLDLKNLGVMMEVTPELRSDNLIDLELAPKVIDLIGYDSYQVTPDNARLWAIQGNNLQSSMAIGRFPIPHIPGVIEDAYNRLTGTISEDNSTSGDVNYHASVSGNSPAYYDQRRMWGDDELIKMITQYGRMPYYRLREMTTQLTVADGSTVGLGGLIYDKLENFKDKVPVLGSIPLVGRLFRSEGEKSVKRNLMIFVTATQVDVNGRKASDLALRK